MKLDDWRTAKYVAEHFEFEDAATVYSEGKAGHFEIVKWCGKWMVYVPSLLRYLADKAGLDKPKSVAELKLLELEERLRAI